MNILSLVNALPGAAAQGLIWGIMAIGVYLTFRILDVADLTVDGTMCTGGAGIISGCPCLPLPEPECLQDSQPESFTPSWESRQSSPES